MNANATIREKIKEAVEILPSVADKENWKVTLDSDEGTLFYSPENIPAGSELYQVSDEYSLYLNKKSYKPRGLTIEYFNENYLKHHTEVKKLADKMFADKKAKIVVVSSINDTTTAFKALLERDLILESSKEQEPQGNMVLY